MPRKRNPVPKLCRHKATDRAYARVNGRQIYFGTWGSDEAREAYRRFVAEHASGVEEEPASREPRPAVITVAELVVRYWRHIEQSGRSTKN